MSQQGEVPQVMTEPGGLIWHGAARMRGRRVAVSDAGDASTTPSRMMSRDPSSLFRSDPGGA